MLITHEKSSMAADNVRVQPGSEWGLCGFVVTMSQICHFVGSVLAPMSRMPLFWFVAFVPALCREYAALSVCRFDPGTMSRICCFVDSSFWPWHRVTVHPRPCCDGSPLAPRWLYCGKESTLMTPPGPAVTVLLWHLVDGYVVRTRR